MPRDDVPRLFAFLCVAAIAVAGCHPSPPLNPFDERRIPPPSTGAIVIPPSAAPSLSPTTGAAAPGAGASLAADSQTRPVAFHEALTTSAPTLAAIPNETGGWGQASAEAAPEEAIRIVEPSVKPAIPETFIGAGDVRPIQTRASSSTTASGWDGETTAARSDGGSAPAKTESGLGWRAPDKGASPTTNDRRQSADVARYGQSADFQELRGRLEYSPDSRRWSLRYAPSGSAPSGSAPSGSLGDSLGGRVELSDGDMLEDYHDGDFVTVRGALQRGPGSGTVYRLSEVRSAP